MKNIKIALLIVSIALLAGCSKEKNVSVTPPVVTPPDVPAVVELSKTNVRDFVVDAAATNETIALFYNLKILSKTSFAVGQQDAFNGFYNNAGGMSDIKKTTGSDPALLGSDFMFITDKDNNGQANNWFYQQEQNTISQVKQAYASGMINIFCWHLREPFNENSFYTSDMTATEKATAFKSILPGGVKHDWYIAKLDKIASVFKKLTGPNGELIPVIFRPFHEFDGSFFWWGADYCTADEFKTMFKFTVDYLKNTKGVHNILYAYGPDNSYDTQAKYLTRYPGDNYVDVLSMDNYYDLRSGTGQPGSVLANTKLKVVSDLAKSKTKVAAMAETGYQVTPTNAPVAGWFSNYVYGALTNNSVEVAFVMFWVNGGNSYFVPVPGNSNVDDFKDFCNKPKALLQNELPNMYKIP